MVRYVAVVSRRALVPVLLSVMFAALGVVAQTQDPSAEDEARIQRDISFQRSRLSNADPEVRRDAVLQLGAMRRADASRAASPALGDADERVRAAACAAVVSLPGDEAATLLVTLLGDKRPFIRQEAAYALGKTHSRTATSALINSVQTDQYLHVRAAAAVALGQIADPGAAGPLTLLVGGAVEGKLRDKSETEIDFLRRSAAVALGHIGDRSAVPVLVAVLNNRDETLDTRREAARALGLIGDPSANSALRSALTDRDPYLSEIAFDALARINTSSN